MPASVRSVTVTSTTGTSITGDRPPGTVAGDQLIAIHFNDLSLDTDAPPGWALLGEGSAASHVRVWRRILGSSEPADYTFDQENSADATLHIIAVQGASAAIAPTVAIADGVGGTTLTPGVTPASASHLEIRAVSVDPNPDTVSWAIPAGYTPRGLAQSLLDFVASVVATKQLNSSTTSGDKTFTASPTSSRWGIGVTISVASAVVVAPDPGGPTPPPFAPGRGSALYRYVFRRLLDRAYLGDLDLAGVSFDKRIGQAGSFSATIPIPSRKIGDQIAEIIPRDETVLNRGPGVIACEIYRAGEPWGEYWITGATPSRSRRGTPSIALRGSTLDAYLLQVEIQDDLTEWVGEDQVEIARQLITHMQAQAGANLDLVLQSGTSGVSRDYSYLASENATYGQRLQELAQVDGGFEWTLNLELGTSGLQRKWAWGYPTLGRPDPQHVFTDAPHGGDILEWSEEIDALRGATRWRASGSSTSSDASEETSSLMSSIHEATAHLAAGWPRIDKTITSDTSDPQTLEDYAAFWLAKAGGALRVDQYTVALGAEPSLTPNVLGDKARLFIENEWHLPHSRVRRIIGLGITPVSRENGKEEAQLVLEGQS